MMGGHSLGVSSQVLVGDLSTSVVAAGNTEVPLGLYSPPCSVTGTSPDI